MKLHHEHLLTGVARRKTRPLTERQRAVLACIEASIRERGIAPSRPELAHALGLPSASSVENHLRALVTKERIVLIPHVARGIKLVRQGTVPILRAPGRIGASETLSDHHSGEEMPAISERWLGSRPDCFLLAEGLNAPDIDFDGVALLAVSTKRTPREGDWIIKRIRGKVTCVRHRSEASGSRADGTRGIDGVVIGTVAVRAMVHHDGDTPSRG